MILVGLVQAPITLLNDVPTIPDQVPKMKYRVPASLWLVENNHRLMMSRVAAVRIPNNLETGILTLPILWTCINYTVGFSVTLQDKRQS